MLIDTNNKSQSNKYILKGCKLVNKIYTRLFLNKKNTKNVKENIDSSFENCYEETLRIFNSQGSNFCEKPLSKSVIALTTRFRKIIGYESEIIEKCENNFSSKQKSYKKYILFAFFLIENAKGDVLPKNADIEKKFGVDEWERRSLKDNLVEIKFLIKINKTRFVINKDHELFLEYQQNNK